MGNINMYGCAGAEEISNTTSTLSGLSSEINTNRSFSNNSHKSIPNNGFPDEPWYQNETWHNAINAFHASYLPVHGIISLLICIFGFVSNIVFMFVLTRRQMLSVVNIILTAVAACDSILMASYAVYISNFVLRPERSDGCNSAAKNSFGWIQFALVHANLSVAAHSSSLWLTVSMAVYRYTLIRTVASSSGGSQRAGIGSRLFQPAYLIIILNITGVGLLCVPNCLIYSWRVSQTQPHAFCRLHNEGAVYETWYSNMAFWNGCALQLINFWIGGLAFKIIPCIVLSVFLILLSSAIIRAQEHRRRVLGTHQETGINKDRTTTMLVGIMFIFLVTELPQGILTVLSGCLGQWFHEAIYRNLGDVLDLLSLCNSCVNFILYCVMSSQFRQTLFQVSGPLRIWIVGFTTRSFSRRQRRLNSHHQSITKLESLRSIPEEKQGGENVFQKEDCRLLPDAEVIPKISPRVKSLINDQQSPKQQLPESDFIINNCSYDKHEFDDTKLGAYQDEDTTDNQSEVNVVTTMTQAQRTGINMNLVHLPKITIAVNEIRVAAERYKHSTDSTYNSDNQETVYL